MEESLTYGSLKASGLAEAGQTEQLARVAAAAKRMWRTAPPSAGACLCDQMLLTSLVSPTSPCMEPHPLSNNDCPGSWANLDLQR